ncbi:MAG: hypothetical protein ACFFB5_17475 [Promethearchaeota archaeon]
MIVLISLVILIIIERLLISNDYTSILQNIAQSPSNMARYFPITILLYLLTKEIIFSSKQNDPLLKFSVIQKGLVFIQNFNMYLALFETFSVGKIQTSELKQLKHLKAFSLELDTSKACARVFLYSKSYKELKKRIKKSMPILEVVLPDIKFISKDNITRFLGENKLLKVRKKFLLEENSELILPKSLNLDTKLSPTVSRMILACIFPEEMSIEESTDEKKMVQCYLFHSYSTNSFFKYMNNMLFNTPKKKGDYFWDIRELQRMRLKYQTEEISKINLQKGLHHFKEGLSMVLSELKQVIIQEQQINYSPIKLSSELKSKNLLSSGKTIKSLEMNQICSELCNIPGNISFLQEEKERKCQQRVSFCRKLLTNDNFSSILEIILDQKYEKDQIRLFTELKSHFSHQQLICVLAHLSQSNSLEIPYHKIINMIYILLKLNYKAQGSLNANKRHQSSNFFKDEKFKQISLSLAKK